MLQIIYTMRELSFGRLMAVYEDTNRQRYPQLPLHQALAQAEQELYDYLRNDFFTISCAVICVWQEAGEYISALRLEPYRDGMLITALETKEMKRGMGFATHLIQAVQVWQEQSGDVILYSHIANGNLPSISVHEKCGFVKISDSATYLNGDVSSHAGTYRYIG